MLLKDTLKSKSIMSSGMAPLRTPYSFRDVMRCYAQGSYDNTFPAITRIAQQFMTIPIHAIDANGRRVDRAPILDAIARPMLEMSGISFKEALAVMMLVHPTIFLVAWHYERGNPKPVRGAGATKDNIAGFTFLEFPEQAVIGDEVVYRVGSNVYHEHEVLRLSMNINPYDVLSGYSPSVSAKKWATIDDYIADYQSGFFRNGAIPAGQFIITAPSKDAFDKIVDSIELKHQGANKNNNSLYVHRPIDGATGNALGAQVEWVPFTQPNKELGLEQLFDQANKKIDGAFGVPDEIKGYLQNSNYASVNVADYVMQKYVVYPATLKIWSSFTHEMNRITGGLGVALSFKFEKPVIADEEKVRAESKNIEMGIINQAVQSGYSLDSVVDAFGFPEEYKLLKVGSSRQPAPKDHADVDEGGETENVPSQVETYLYINKQFDEMKRFMSEQKEKSEAKPAGKTESETKKKQTPGSPNNDYVDRVADIIRDHMKTHVEDVIEKTKSKAVEDSSEEEIDEFAEALLAALVIIMLSEGSKQFTAGLSLISSAGLSVEAATQYVVSSPLKNSYLEYLKNVAKSYDADTAISIRRVLEQGAAEGWDKETVATRLRGIMETDEWRVQRLASSEVHRSSGLSSLDAMSQLSDETGAKLVKIWHLNPGTANPCPDCVAMDGKRIPLSGTFIQRGGELPASGRVNDFMDIESADAHPNCHCYLTYEVVLERSEKSIKVECPSCKRYMFETNGGEVKNFICQNSKCKKHWDVSAKNGKASLSESSMGA